MELSKETQLLLSELSDNTILDLERYKYSKEYYKMEECAYITKIAHGDIGSIQDGYILFGIASLTACTSSALLRFLKAYQNKYKELQIGFKGDNNEDFLHPFLSKFLACGLIVRHWYVHEDDTDASKAYTCYTLTNKGLVFCKSILQRHNIHLKMDTYLTPSIEVLGVTEVANVASRIVKHSNFVEVLDREVTYPATKMNKSYIPCTFKFCTKEQEHIIGMWPLYFDNDKRRHNDTSYKNYVTDIINQIVIFLNYRTRRNTLGIADAIVLVKDSAELAEFISILSLSKNIDEALPHIYITCKKINEKGYKVEQSFISLEKVDDIIVPAFKKVDFLM